MISRAQSVAVALPHRSRSKIAYRVFLGDVELRRHSRRGMAVAARPTVWEMASRAASGLDAETRASGIPMARPTTVDSTASSMVMGNADRVMSTTDCPVSRS